MSYALFKYRNYLIMKSIYILASYSYIVDILFMINDVDYKW